jgi:hypothetical protein
MKTIQLINYIATHPEYVVIVINDQDYNKMRAIEILSSEDYSNEWRINGSLEKYTLICSNA